MAQVVPLPSADNGPHRDHQARRLKPVPPIESALVVCALCGRPLSRDQRRFSLVSPIGRGTRVTVCSTCHRAALGEGYRPAV